MRRFAIIGTLMLVAMLAAGCATVSTSGEFTLDSGEVLRGHLIITSGVATLETDSRVTGDIYMTSGILNANGEIEGDIIVSSGRINLGPEAFIHGDVRGTSGSVTQADGARVSGRVTTDTSGFRIGTGIFSSLFFVCCLLPLLFLGLLVWLVITIARRKRSEQTKIAVQQTSAPSPSWLPGPAQTDAAQKLKQLKQLLDDGLISEDDYEAKKTEILQSL